MSDEPKPFRGSCADDPLGEELIDILPILALAGFAPEISSCRFLCNETFEIRERGAVAEVLKNALDACGAPALRAHRNPLDYVVKNGNEARIRLLLALGAQINKGWPYRQVTVLATAVISGRPNVVKLLLDRGADIDQPIGVMGYTALMYAVILANEAMVLLLLKHGANIKFEARSNCRTALCCATSPHTGNRGIAALLRAHGAE
jgi:ankyrin repeat protein